MSLSAFKRKKHREIDRFDVTQVQQAAAEKRQIKN
jgi:hypothetical protein